MGFTGRPTNPARPYLELRTWKAAIFTVTGVMNPALHLLLLLLRAEDVEYNPGIISYGCNKPVLVTSHPLSANFASGTSKEPVVTSPNRKWAFIALSASSVPGVMLHCHLPSSILAYYLAEVFSATQGFDSASVP